MLGGIGYRFGFNGKENDKDFGNKQLIQDYGFRIYNPAIVKFLSVDPLSASYPWYTPYQFAGNKPIVAIDLDGAEEYNYVLYQDRSGDTYITLSHENQIIEYSWTEGNRNTRRQVKHVDEKQRYILSVELEMDRNMGPGVPIGGWQYVSLMKYSVDKGTVDLLANASPSERSAIVRGANEDGKKAFLKYMTINSATSIAGALLGKFAPAITSRMRSMYASEIPPQSLTAGEWSGISKLIQDQVGDLSDDVVAQGSRASYKATNAKPF